MNNRIYKLDNLKAILIFLVIIGHLFEWISGEQIKFLYRTIYIFHMPLFFAVSGYFAKYKPHKNIAKHIFLYALFQIIYLAFDCYVIHRSEKLVLQFTTPYWLLWFLLVMIGYELIIPLLDTENKKVQLFMLVFSVLLSLLSGYDSTVGYYLSVGRFSTFLPFFVLGYYAKKNQDYILKVVLHKYTKGLLMIIALIGIGVSLYLTHKSYFGLVFLYGGMPYASSKGTLSDKCLLLFFAICWGIVLLFLIPNKQIRVMSTVGQNTFWIFILHGFIVRYLGYKGIFCFGMWQNFALANMIAATICILLGVVIPSFRKNR